MWNNLGGNVKQLQISAAAEQELIKELQKTQHPEITDELQIMLDEFFKRCEGLFTIQLNPYELATFNKLCYDGLAQRDYDHALGRYFNMAKVARTPI